MVPGPFLRFGLNQCQCGRFKFGKALHPSPNEIAQRASKTRCFVCNPSEGSVENRQKSL